MSNRNIKNCGFINPFYKYNTIEDLRYTSMTEPIIKFSNLKYYYLFSYIAILCFFPTGLFSLYYIRKTNDCYKHNELEIGNIYFKKSYRLAQFSAALGTIFIIIFCYVYL